LTPGDDPNAGITDAVKTAPSTIVGQPKFSTESLGFVPEKPAE
jgi:hypothetical protein